ncbi:hypothetical protein ACWEQ2_20720 [Streptomyces sp. NPDC004096]|uniref:hypothetical protein n=1 Tax=unclassified Streptomyces TaxID=2593676 RepID=UPI0033A11728
MPDPSRPTIVIGADRRIGAAVAECLARQGHVKDEAAVTTGQVLHSAGGPRC